MDQLCNAQELPGMYLQIHYTAIVLFWKIPSTVKPYGYSLIIFSQIRKAAGQKRESRTRPTAVRFNMTNPPKKVVKYQEAAVNSLDSKFL
jgi:hypothetical protein